MILKEHYHKLWKFLTVSTTYERKQKVVAVQAFDIFFEEIKDPTRFYERVTELLSKQDAEGYKDAFDRAFVDEYNELSRYLDISKIQESCAVRNVLKCRFIANQLVRNDGTIDQDRLLHLIELFSEHLYSLSPGRLHDQRRDEHILKMLQKLKNDKALFRTIQNMTRPFSNKLAEDIIRDTLDLDQTVVITDVHVRRAALMASLTTLRQSLGSCFATAPAIVIHEEQPELFLKDLDEMMNTGSMKRTFGGIEYSVPMSSSWGGGDLKKPLFLHRNLKESDQKIWCSPGLLRALTATQLIEKDLSLQEQSKKLLRLLEKVWGEIGKNRDLFYTTGEEILQAIFLDAYGLKQKEIDDHQNKPKEMITSSLMVITPKGTKKTKDLEDRIALFFKQMSIAKTAFRVLADTALLKAWEFTLASFSEIKLQFARYNLYTSLGVNYDDPGGIGEFLYQNLFQKVERAKLELKEYQDQYEQIFSHIRYLEQRLQTASTEQEMHYLKVEYQSRKADLHHIEALRNQFHAKAQKTAHLQQVLIDFYDVKFRDYFQEVYDPDIHDIASGPFDDSPAGFRLLYKHGRMQPSLWTKIYSLSEFIDALVSFFTLTEHELRSLPEIEGIEEEVSSLITQLVHHVRSDHFLESAFHRMSRAHGLTSMARPLEHLDEVAIKPWVYPSGGSMDTLVSAYFRREEKPTEVSRWVESPNELFAYCIDTIRHLSAAATDPYLQNESKSMLMHSPTHAFLLKPGFFEFKAGWQSNTYAYSWIKQEVIEPMEEWMVNMYISEDAHPLFIEELVQKVSPEFGEKVRDALTHLPDLLHVRDFRNTVLERIEREKSLQWHRVPVLTKDDIDSTLFSSLPYVSIQDAKQKLAESFELLFDQELVLKEKVQALLQRFCKESEYRTVFSAKQLQEIAQSLIAMALRKTRTRENYLKKIVQAFRKTGLCMPAPVIFADTNWMKEYFAFVVNPGTGELEFWSVDCLALSGRKVSHWDVWLYGQKREPRWGLYTKPQEYVGR